MFLFCLEEDTIDTDLFVDFDTSAIRVISVNSVFTSSCWFAGISSTGIVVIAIYLCVLTTEHGIAVVSSAGITVAATPGGVRTNASCLRIA